MKKYALSVLLFLSALSGYPQRPVPANYTSTTPVNYVRVWDIVKPETNPNSITASTGIQIAHMSTQYIDGLGRPLETVVKEGAYNVSQGNPVDLVVANWYDENGKESVKYLPFGANNAGSNTSISDGLFKLNAFQQQAQYMQQEHGSQGETYFYSQTDFDPSPLNRPLKQMPEGNSWVGAGKGVVSEYLVNTTADEVRVWSLTEVPSSFATYGTSSTYPAGSLYKYVTTDENGKKMCEFKDKDGRLIIKKAQVSDNPGLNHTGWLCTYYIYDDLGRLRAVFQPGAIEQLAVNGWQLTTSILNEQCFRYEYDTRHRISMKKVPGAGAVYLVYDKRDRLVLVQDANLRTQNKWLFTKYDQMNRPIMTGLYTNSSQTGQTTMQGYLNSQNMGFYESDNFSSFPYTLNQSFPVVAGADVLTIDYYDDYRWVGWYGIPSTLDNSHNGYFSTNYSSWPYPQQVKQGSARGKATGHWDRVGPGPVTAIYYDEKGQVIQVRHFNYTGGFDLTTTQYSFTGQPLTTVQKTEKAGSNSQTLTVITRNELDNLGRLNSVSKEVSSQVGGNTITTPNHVIASYTYDKMSRTGSLVHAPLYNSGSGLHTLSYDYNIRGWLLGANRSYVATQGQSGANRFGFELGYDKLSSSAGRSFTAAQFNGNINGIVWKSDGDDVRRKYDFSYDPVNRLLKGIFEQDDAAGTWNSSTMDYRIQMGNGTDGNTAYDANGNIKAMKQYGWKPGVPSSLVDNLSYRYFDNGNRLRIVVDESNDVNTRLGDFRTAASHPNAGIKTIGNIDNTGIVDYDYDDNGNLKLDNNKAISSITYNYLNLPEVITITGKGTITYTYDAAGNKLKKVTVDNTVIPSKTTTSVYIGDAIFENDQLQFIAHKEGRIRFKPANNSFQFDYFLKDHLGNVRMVLTEEQQTDPYETLTFENAQATQQNAQWENASGNSIDISTVRTGSISGFNAGTGNGDFVRMIKRSTGTIGAAKLLKVMAGDRIHTYVEYYYSTLNSSTNNAGSNPLNSFINGLAGAFANSNHVSSVLKNDVSAINSQLSANNNFTTFIDPSPNTSGGNEAPKAYLNVLFFDDQFKFDQASSRVIKISYAVNSKQLIDKRFAEAITANKSGYVYVYFSNESETSVYFDNFMLSHERGSLVEETHYYPFGLTMTGISSNALAFGSPDNKRKWNKGSELESKEFSDGSGLELYATPLRSLDPQLGRWWQIDSKPDYSQSLYSSMGNNPILMNDPLGDTAILGINNGAALGLGHQILIYQNKDKSWSVYSMGAATDEKGADLVSGRTGSGEVTIKALTAENFKGLPEGPLTSGQITEFLAGNKLGNTKVSDPIVIGTTQKQDEAIAANATQSQADFASGKEKYNLYNNNSTHATMGVLNDKTGLDLPVTGGPRSTHAQVKETIKVRAMTPEERAAYNKKQDDYTEKLKADALMNFN